MPVRPDGHSLRKACLLLAALQVLPLTDIAFSQTLQNVPFPTVLNIQVTDCSTPTVLDAGGGQTITLTGGQFIHYKDPNFDGTMYATTSDAGCPGIPPEHWYDGKPISQISVTFSKPVATVSFGVYNTQPPAQLTFEGYIPQNVASTYYDATGHWVTSIDYGVPALLQVLQYSYPAPGLSWPSVSLIGFTTYDAPKVWWEGGSPATQWSWGITSLMIPTKPDVVTFDYTGSNAADGKILISTAASDASYPSQYQVTPPTSVSIQVEVGGTLLDGTTKQPKQGTVYLRATDPPDTAPYRGADAYDGDNDGPAAHLENEDQSGIATVQTDSNGHFQTKLTITPGANGVYTAGDNYRITASTNAQMNCGGVCPTSGIFTLWKRVYVEEEHMFRAGAFISTEAQAGTRTIPVDDPAPFLTLQPGASLELVHADVVGNNYYSDLVMFGSVQQQSNGTWEVATLTTIPRTYGQAPQNLQSSPLAFARDGVGIADAGVYQPNDDFVQSLYQSIFVDLSQAHVAVAETPYVRELTASAALFYTSAWLQNGQPGNPFRRPSPNVLHRIGAAQTPLYAPSGPCVGAEVGATVVDGGINYSLILQQRIEDLAAGLIHDPTCNVTVGVEYLGAPTDVVNGETTAHETTHFWIHSARLQTMDTQGHCNHDRWEHDGLQCLLHSPYQGSGLYDGLVDLHYESHGSDSEYMWIRRDPDPVPQQ